MRAVHVHSIALSACVITSSSACFIASPSASAITCALPTWPRPRGDFENVRSDDADTAKEWMSIRQAELANDVARLKSIRADGRLTSVIFADRLALAERAIAERTSAKTSRQLAAVEDAIASNRLALAARCEPLARRQLELEAAEDLLLRALSADASDVAIALGVATNDERTRAAHIVRTLTPLFTNPAINPLNADATSIATDPAIFREAMLAGLLAALHAECAHDESQRDTPGEDDGTRGDQTIGSESAGASTVREDRAMRYLALAARSELPIPSALSDALAIAQARMIVRTTSGTMPSIKRSTPDTLAELSRTLETASRSNDLGTALLARMLRSKLDGGAPRLPLQMTHDTMLDVIAACAASDALAASDVSTRDLSSKPSSKTLSKTPSDRSAALDSDKLRSITEPLDTLFPPVTTSTASSKSTTIDTEQRTALASLIRARMTPRLLAAAAHEHAPPLLAALGALRIDPSGLRVDLMPSQVETLDRAARDARIAPWFTIPYAAALLRENRENAQKACDHLLVLVAKSEASARTRDAFEIALVERRADALRSQTGEARLAEALLLATRVFSDDPSRDAWVLEACDLALFPRFGQPNLEEADRLLTSLRQEGPSRELRTLELLAERRLADPSKTTEANDIKSRAEALRRALNDGLPQDLSPIALRARVEALCAGAALAASDFPATLAFAAAAMDSEPTSLAAQRAAIAWIGAAAKCQEPFASPTKMQETLRQFPSVRSALTDTVAALALSVEADVELGALADPSTLRTRRIRAQQLEALASPLDTTDDERSSPSVAASVPTVDATLLHALGLLARESISTAVDRARVALERDPSNRFALWILGEALVASDDPKARSEGFRVLRDLAPIGASERDRLWWRAQARMLEVLADEVARGDLQRASDITARVNRLTVIDQNLGGDVMSRRIKRARDLAKSPSRANTPQTETGAAHDR